MTWFRQLENIEYYIIAAFLLLNIVYIFRVIHIGKVFRTGWGKVFIKFFLRLIYFSLIIIALLGPSHGESQKEIKSVGKDIMIAVDLSQSMNAFDIQPTRLEKLKFELKKIIGAFDSDRIGLIIFSSEAFMQCPLTYDHNTLNMFVEILHTGLVPNAGTDFSPPLELALEKLNEDENLVTQQTSKAIILISDGEDFGEKTSETLKQIEEQGIKLFTLGIGTQTGSRIKTDRGFKLDHENNEVVTKLNPEALMKLADETGGTYFEINETNNDISRLINHISEIEGEIRDVRQVDVSTNKYFYFLLLALGLLCLDILINVKTIKI
ncbi:MAG: VWA domain-containing protein [Cyclobacteriaceae bacterium]|nr:VWA domain-containing protein [Cyclobacteriaceae bacterium]